MLLIYFHSSSFTSSYLLFLHISSVALLYSFCVFASHFTVLFSSFGSSPSSLLTVTYFVIPLSAVSLSPTSCHFKIDHLAINDPQKTHFFIHPSSTKRSLIFCGYSAPLGSLTPLQPVCWWGGGWESRYLHNTKQFSRRPARCPRIQLNPGTVYPDSTRLHRLRAQSYKIAL